MNTFLRVALAQVNATVGDFAGNQSKIIKALKTAKQNKVDLLIFPEMVSTGYPPEDLLYRKDFIKKSDLLLKAVKLHTNGLLAVVGAPYRTKDNMLYNAAYFFANGKIVARHLKNELPNYGVFDERRYFSPHHKYTVIQLGDLKIGLSICEDIWPASSHLYSKTFKNTLSLLINISASPFHLNKYHEREKLIRGLARHLAAPVAYLNLVGGQDELVFDGSSLIIDPNGRVLCRAHAFSEDLRFIDLHLKKPNKNFQRKSQIVKIQDVQFSKKRSDEASLKKPILKSIVGELEALEEAYQALVLGTRDYVLKNRFKKALIGISGGIDSALVTCIAVDALGAQNVTGVTMPSNYTSPKTLRDAQLLAKNLNIPCLKLPIRSVFKSYQNLLKPIFKKLKWDTTEENLQARIRGTALMALSNKLGYLVLTTGNKSEMATGYCTLYGDMAGGFAVIKDVPKTLVYKLSHYRNTLGIKPPIPGTILKRAPSAELRFNQKDQDTLPPYSVLDSLIEEYINRDKAPNQIKTLSPSSSLLKKVIRMIDVNEYKRRQAPPGIKITPKAFGRDRRLPITNQFSA